jgi:hypothetical protein
MVSHLYTCIFMSILSVLLGSYNLAAQGNDATHYFPDYDHSMDDHLPHRSIIKKTHLSRIVRTESYNFGSSYLVWDVRGRMEYRYNYEGQLIKVFHYDFTDTSRVLYWHKHLYDEEGRIIGIDYYDNDYEAGLLDVHYRQEVFQYNCDKNKNESIIQRITTGMEMEADTSTLINLSDDQNRIIRSTFIQHDEKSESEWSYSNSGDTLIVLYSQYGVRDFSFEQDSTYTMRIETKKLFDKNGNLLFVGTNYISYRTDCSVGMHLESFYKYDEFNRLIEADDKEVGFHTFIMRSYDANGEYIEQLEYPDRDLFSGYTSRHIIAKGWVDANGLKFYEVDFKADGNPNRKIQYHYDFF